MTVTWTSGYGINEAMPFVEWGMQGEDQTRSPAGTLTFTKNSLCGMLWHFPEICSINVFFFAFH
jgi:acid phosphatase type 7